MGGDSPIPATRTLSDDADVDRSIKRQVRMKHKFTQLRAEVTEIEREHREEERGDSGAMGVELRQQLQGLAAEKVSQPEDWWRTSGGLSTMSPTASRTSSDGTVGTPISRVSSESGFVSTLTLEGIEDVAPGDARVVCPSEGWEYVINKRIEVIGRASKSTPQPPEGVDIVVRHDKTISRIPAAIVYDDGNYALQCIGKCRIVVDGERLRTGDASRVLHDVVLSQ